MFEELNERRKAVERNIAKGFGMDDADLDFEKALEDELEKGRAKKTFSVGDTFTRHGITYKCTGISANTGRPTWSKVKDGESGKQEQPEQKSGSGYGKKIPDEQVKSFARILKQVDAMHTDASRYIDEDGMDDEQLANFKIVIDTFKNDQNLNASTRRNIANWSDLVDEEIKFRKEQIKKISQKPKKLSELKRGDTVALIMERYNPQLGDYVTIKKVQIEGTTSKSFKIDYMKFDKETGERSDKSSSVYGSSKHYILLPEEVNSHIKDGKWKGDRISGGNPFENE